MLVHSKSSLFFIAFFGGAVIPFQLSKDGSSSVSGDTLVPGSPWEKPDKKTRKHWRKIVKPIIHEQMALDLHDALDLMGIDDKKAMKPPVNTKMPPLDKPKWFNGVVENMMDGEPPEVGKQVP